MLHRQQATDASKQMNTSNRNISTLQFFPERIEQNEMRREVQDNGPQKATAGGSELDAAEALGSLVSTPSKSSRTNEKMMQNEFVLPEIYTSSAEAYTRSGKKKATPFPLKLMQLLACNDYSDIITWLPDGKSFSIIKPKAFITEILPVHFKTAKYNSFIRKLHRWGFRQVRGDDPGTYSHKWFVKNRVDLVEKITACHKPKRPRYRPQQITSLSTSNHPRRGQIRAQPVVMPGLMANNRYAGTGIDSAQNHLDSQVNDLARALVVDAATKRLGIAAAHSLRGTYHYNMGVQSLGLSYPPPTFSYLDLVPPAGTTHPVDFLLPII